ncbi:adenine deaminase [Hymenobacter taeanensis]|uniref:Adenine deaminase n=1 Tax=Hymenobacter taeanensis TaxID=2735321 RepID=A0A6M6BGX7_9BACT|nr:MULTISPECIES: adenine deaminase [Hymenobacter]QJX47396.1 adenine deaminase [Hymenobacter taeanensis]UOQ79265.1 adenine deaminase [Hymenobacter sp. 5414T-23]
MSADFQLQANVINLFTNTITPATLHVAGGRIQRITPLDAASPTPELPYALPGFVDAHVHVESSLLVPSEFARLAVVHGTVATVSDPHEIGNVLGVAGVKYMLENGRQVPFKFCFGAPSCVPATPFETAGAEITAADIETLFKEHPEIGYLAEMMNWPGVLHRDEVVMEKIRLAQQYGRPVDGHAPGLRGENARQYAAAGISTDHECFTAEEAQDKLAVGMKILVREGSAARNFEALIDLLPEHYEHMMFCSDDKHPDTLVLGHINQLVQRAVSRGQDVLKVLRVACRNPVEHYNLPVGLLREGDPADFIVVDNLTDFNVQQTYLNGELVAEKGQTLIPAVPVAAVNNFHTTPVQPTDFQVAAPQAAATVRVIECFDGQLITARHDVPAHVEGGLVLPDLEQDVLKLTVVNRYQPAAPAVAFIQGFGLKRGALASSVGHDSHNITAVGCDDESLARAVNLVIAAQGGLAVVSPDGEELVLPLPVAGLMSDREGYHVAEAYAAVDALSKQLGSPLQAPFMTLSFMALLVIPSLKLSDKGLFDGEAFRFVEAVV